MPPEERSAPLVHAALTPVQGASVPGAPQEPVLDVADIQGNSLVGFNKDHQAFLFLEMTSGHAAKASLRAALPRIATVAEVLAGRRLYRALRRAQATRAPAGFVMTFVNVAFTYEGLRKLAPDASRLSDDAFKLGLAARSSFLGDPNDPSQEGHPSRWVVGGPGTRCDLVFIVASDESHVLDAELEALKRKLGIGRGSDAGGLRLVYEQRGDALPRELTGHEHFGFRDGISQPGVRGRVSDAPLDYLTPRYVDPRDPRALRFAKPGQPLIWPGQFVLGYPFQAVADDVAPSDAAYQASPRWARNGSFLVVRRLRQLVARFWTFADAQAHRLAASPSFAGMTAERFAALLVGRWPSGAPVMRSPDADIAELGADEIAANDFAFCEETVSTPLHGAREGEFPRAPGDPGGARCPFAAHLRKVNPRDDSTDVGTPRRTLQLRILRRGIAYGAPVGNRRDPAEDAVDRGLMFLSYQSSIQDQFEFVARHWANGPTVPRAYDDAPAGHDPVIGQAADVPARVRTATLRGSDGTAEVVSIPQDWIVPTGGGYFFAPSISALRDVLLA